MILDFSHYTFILQAATFFILLTRLVSLKKGGKSTPIQQQNKKLTFIIGKKKIPVTEVPFLHYEQITVSGKYRVELIEELV